MPTIDRYLLRQFVNVFIICSLSLTGLYVVIDAFGHLDHFIVETEHRGGLLAVMGEYYAFQSIKIFDRTSGIFALVSAMFTVTWIQRHHELTALLAAGIPKLRIVTPILLAAISVSLVSAVGRELLIPKIRHKLAADSRDLSGEKPRDVQPRWDNATDIYLDGDATIAKQQQIRKPIFRLPWSLSHIGQQLSARNAYYQAPSGQRPGGYLMEGILEPADLCSGSSLVVGDRPIVLTPRDFEWLTGDQCFVVSDVPFEMLANAGAWRDHASTLDLIRGLRSSGMELGNDVRVAIHNRIVQPLLDGTLLFLGLPLVMSRNNRNMFLAIGLCLLVITCFLLVVLGCQSLGTSNWIQPELAAWIPLMIFVPLAAALFDPLRE